MPKKVFVSGCFDMLHSGHIEFFREAAEYGDLFVALGADKTIYDLKQRPTVNKEAERLFMVEAISYVHKAFISQGSGHLDFEGEFRSIKPEYLIVNADGHSPEKEALAKEVGTEYIVLKRKPHTGLKRRSTTDLRQDSRIPYRIDLAGGWLDQPWVSKHYPGAVITISLEPTIEFNTRSGMASSTRHSAVELWETGLPADEPEKLAKILFSYDNPPGTKTISGSQDSIGIVFPGLAKADYEGEYWPESIEHVTDNELLSFLENSLYLVPLGPRKDGFDALADTKIDEAGAKALAEATEGCWEAILRQDRKEFGKYFRASFEAQIAMFPNMMTPAVQALIDRYSSETLGWKLSGAGGGGYLILISNDHIPDAIRVTARREFTL